MHCRNNFPEFQMHRYKTIVCVQRFHRYSSDPVLANDAHFCLKGYEYGYGVRRRDSPAAVPARRDPADWTVAFHAKAHRLTPLVGLVVVVASRIQTNISTERRNRTYLMGRY